MAYLICRNPRVLSRISTISTVKSSLATHSKPFAPIIYRAISTSSEPQVDESLFPQPIDRSYETPDITRARLLYQSRKRGILETDLLLSTFANKHLATLTETEMREYDKLLDEPDWDIYYWATLKKPIPEQWKDSRILALLQDHVKNEGKVILRMPDLQL